MNTKYRGVISYLAVFGLAIASSISAHAGPVKVIKKVVKTGEKLAGKVDGTVKKLAGTVESEVKSEVRLIDSAGHEITKEAVVLAKWIKSEVLPFRVAHVGTDNSAVEIWGGPAGLYIRLIHDLTQEVLKNESAFGQVASAISASVGGAAGTIIGYALKLYILVYKTVITRADKGAGVILHMPAAAFLFVPGLKLVAAEVSPIILVSTVHPK